MSYIYMTMVLLWGRSVRTRIIHPQMRYCLTGVAFSLLALLFLALCRWTLFEDSPAFDRFCRYMFYIPLVTCPLLLPAAWVYRFYRGLTSGRSNLLSEIRYTLRRLRGRA